MKVDFRGDAGRRGRVEASEGAVEWLNGVAMDTGDGEEAAESSQFAMARRILFKCTCGDRRKRANPAIIEK